MKKVVLAVMLIILSPLILAQETIWIAGDSLSLNYNGEGYPPQLDKLMNSNSIFYNLAMPRQRCDYVIEYEIPRINDGDYAIVLCGINDIYSGENSSQVIQDIKEICLLLQEKNITPIFLTISPNDMPETCNTVLEVNSYLRQFASEQNLILIDSYNSLTNGDKCHINKDLFQDYVHLNKKGNSIVANLIWEQAFNKTVYSDELYSEPSLIKRILSWFGF